MAGEFKYIICCDFDGVLNSYKSGWKGPTVIDDPPVPGAMEWLDLMTQDANHARFEIAIYSSRSKEPGGVEAMRAWLRTYFLTYLARDGVFIVAEGEPVTDLGPAKMAAVDRLMDRLSFPTQKPAASMTIDDRAFHFQGRFPDAESLLDFKPWTKLKRAPMHVYLDGTLLHPDLVVSCDVQRGEVEVLIAAAQRTAGIGPEYVPLFAEGSEVSDHVYEALPRTVRLYGKVRCESVDSSNGTITHHQGMGPAKET